MRRDQVHRLQHGVWPPGWAEIAAKAPAEGRPEGAAVPMHQSRKAHHPARPLHSPWRAMPSEPSKPASRRGDKGTGGARDCHRATMVKDITRSPAPLRPWQDSNLHLTD
jgi:hypothetical protein